jgi:hypothetical protein
VNYEYRDAEDGDTIVINVVVSSIWSLICKSETDSVACKRLTALGSEQGPGRQPCRSFTSALIVGSECHYY